MARDVTRRFRDVILETDPLVVGEMQRRAERGLAECREGLAVDAEEVLGRLGGQLHQIDRARDSVAPRRRPWDDLAGCKCGTFFENNVLGLARHVSRCALPLQIDGANLNNGFRLLLRSSNVRFRRQLRRQQYLVICSEGHDSILGGPHAS